VRLYEKWGLIPPVERGPYGYRRFTQRHLDCLLLARMVFKSPYTGRSIRRSGVRIIEAVVSGDLKGGLTQAIELRTLVQAERHQAEEAASVLERWAAGELVEEKMEPVHSARAARILRISKDVLRNWERNGLIHTPRHPDNRYRLYGSDEIQRLRIIRLLSQAGYSQMAILRMVTQLDRGKTHDLRRALDTPLPGEDILTAADRWLSTLQEQADQSDKIIAFVRELLDRDGC
jgi:DNA-binding transcriptional MerR regulator